MVIRPACGLTNIARQLLQTGAANFKIVFQPDLKNPRALEAGQCAVRRWRRPDLRACRRARRPCSPPRSPPRSQPRSPAVFASRPAISSSGSSSCGIGDLRDRRPAGSATWGIFKLRDGALSHLDAATACAAGPDAGHRL